MKLSNTLFAFVIMLFWAGVDTLAQDTITHRASLQEVAKRSVLKVDTIATVAEGGSRYNLQELTSMELGIQPYQAAALEHKIAVQVLGYYIDENGDPDGVIEGNGVYTLVHNAELTANGTSVFAAHYTFDSRPENLDAFWVLGLGGLLGNGSLATEPEDYGYRGLVNYGGSIFILGDSITYGSGAGGFANAFSNIVARSLLNSESNSFGHHCVLNQTQAIYSGYTTTGAALETGVSGFRRELEDGENITITERNYSTVYAIYDADASSGDIIFRKNGGAAYKTETVSGSGIQITGPAITSFTESDTLTIEASGGTVVVCGVHTLQTAAQASLVYVCGNSGKAWQDFVEAEELDEIASYMNFFKAGAEKLCIIALGTNNIYAPAKATTPEEMIDAVETVVAGLNDRLSSLRIVFVLPPRAAEASWPVVKNGYRYEEYAFALARFAEENQIGIVRMDRTALSTKEGFYADGLHPNVYGHRIIAAELCETLGITINHR